LLIGREFLRGEPSALILGDNLFHGHQFSALLQRVGARTEGCSLFACHVPDPHRYGVVELDDAWRPVALVEKPEHPKSNYAVTGLYFYDSTAPDIAATLQPSRRGELEITDLNRVYLEAGKAEVEILGRGYAWLDTGTPESLMQASQFIGTIQTRQGLMIACPEEIAWRAGWIDAAQLERTAATIPNSLYGRYLQNLLSQR
jgi:glucose-1-phosphate thymidylyltransferase